MICLEKNFIHFLNTASSFGLQKHALLYIFVDPFFLDLLAWSEPEQNKEFYPIKNFLLIVSG